MSRPIRIDDAVLERLRPLAKAEGRNESNMVNWLLSLAIEPYRRGELDQHGLAGFQNFGFEVRFIDFSD